MLVRAPLAPRGYLITEARTTSATIAADPEATTLDEFELAASHRTFRRYTAPVNAESGELVGRIIVLRETTKERPPLHVPAGLADRLAPTDDLLGGIAP